MFKNIYPRDWTTEKMSIIFDFSGGFSATRKDLGEKGIAYLHYGDIHTSKETILNVEKNIYKIPKIELYPETKYSKFLLNHSDIVFVDASEDYDGVSKFIVIDNDKNIPLISGLHTIIAKDKDKILDINFKRYVFQEYQVKKQFMFYAAGQKVKGINKENIKKIVLPVPPLDEQKKIANILSTWDRAIELNEEQLRTEKTMLLQTINTLTKGNSYLQSSYTKIPLDKCSNFINGYAFQSSKYNDLGIYKIITIGNVQDGKLDLNSRTKKVIDIPSNINKNQILSRNDILVSMTGNVGRVCKIEHDNLLLNQRVGKLEPNKSIDRFYFYYALRSSRFLYKMIAKAQGGAQPNLSTKDIKKYYIEVPDLTTQKLIGKYLLFLDTKIELLTKKIHYLRKQKQGLMQQLLTGKIRVQL
ncbi:MAG: restriction endonuclease subunit S [Gammaproteobacteria bacterium]|jgi:type I restriction enzyme S subunit